MAKTKAELEFDNTRYREQLSAARNSLQQHDFLEAIRLAVSALPHVDGMMQYDRRWGSKTDFTSIDSIAIILRFAPLVFDSECLDQLAELLKSQRRIDKNTSADLAADLQAAFATMWDAHRLWCRLEHENEVRQDELRQHFGGDQDKWRWICETWEEMGLVRREPANNSYRVSLVSSLETRVRAKCGSCGVTGQADRFHIYQEIQCPKCSVRSFWVVMHAPN